MHLIEDMAQPAHTNNDIHPSTKTFEDYVADNWGSIVEDVISTKVSPSGYTGGNYNKGGATNPEEYLLSLAKISKRYHYDGLWGSIGDLSKDINDPVNSKLKENVEDLIPLAINYVAGYMDSVYNAMTDPNDDSLRGLVCDEPPDPTSPAGDHPDDRFDVSDEFYWEKEFNLSDAEITDLYLRTATKKGKIGVWYKKRFMEIFFEGRGLPADAPQETKDRIEAEFQAIANNLEQRRAHAESDWKDAPDVALFANGFYKPSTSLMLKIGEPVSFEKVDFDPGIVNDHPVLLVPTGGFYGLENSAVAKATLDEYVKNGGPLVVFTQQHGADWKLLPVPANTETGEKRPVTGYGYQEDQSCQFNSVYVDTYHPILSVFSASTANIGVDGYFTSWPENSTILLRRVANGQPAMIMYSYGNGYVIATTLYTDFALSHAQANSTEINLVQNIISWAKRPATLPEIRPGETVELNINLSNFTDISAALVKFTILDPGRKVISEQTQGVSLSAGQAAAVPLSYISSSTSALGIYHVDYTLLDAQGNTIQPQAETDSGRFVVSNPPGTAYQPEKTFQLWITSPEEYVASGTEVTFTIHIKNNTSQDLIGAKIGIGSHEARSEGGRWWIYREAIEGIDILAGGQVDIPWTFRIDISQSIYFGLFRSDQNPDTWFVSGGLAGTQKGIWLIKPFANLTTATDRILYAKGETVIINTSIKNNAPAGWQSSVKITITDPQNTKVFEDTKSVALLRSEIASVASSFTLPTTLNIGTFTVKVEVWYGTKLIASASTGFELPQSQIAVTPHLPSSFTTGTNTISFILNNTGRISVSSGVLDVSMKDPDGIVVYAGSQPFSIGVAQSIEQSVDISISSPKFGKYTLTYIQSDKTRAGSPTTQTISNTTTMALSLDKPSYRVRETANLTVDLLNTGMFYTDSLSLTVTLPEAGYTNIQTISLPTSANQRLTYAIPLPETLAAGQHTIDVTLALPSGGTIVHRKNFIIPESLLNLGYSGPATLAAGDTINLTAENTGGVDTTYTTEALTVTDVRGVTIYQGSVAGTVMAGERKTLADIQIPFQTANGTVYLILQRNFI